MQDNRDKYEPIIATRRSREPLHDDTQPLWRLVLALGGGLAVVVLLGWWLMGRSSSDGASTTVKTEVSAPEIHVEEAPAPPTTEIEVNSDLAQTPTPSARSTEPAATEQATPESIPEVASNDAVPSPSLPAPVSVRFTSPDTQVRFELRGPLDSSPHLTSKAGAVVALAPGTYRVVASGTQLQAFERVITLDGERDLEYVVELCAERKSEVESLAGRVVEERTCASTAECESMFMVLSEHADRLLKNSAFRAQQCAKWRPGAATSGSWTLDTECGGATLATTCRIEIAQGACTIAEPRRSLRGGACPRAELK